jgi:hypothetical protein
MAKDLGRRRHCLDSFEEISWVQDAIRRCTPHNKPLTQASEEAATLLPMLGLGDTTKILQIYRI